MSTKKKRRKRKISKLPIHHKVKKHVIDNKHVYGAVAAWLIPSPLSK